MVRYVKIGEFDVKFFEEFEECDNLFRFVVVGFYVSENLLEFEEYVEFLEVLLEKEEIEEKFKVFMEKVIFFVLVVKKVKLVKEEIREVKKKVVEVLKRGKRKFLKLKRLF